MTGWPLFGAGIVLLAIVGVIKTVLELPLLLTVTLGILGGVAGAMMVIGIATRTTSDVPLWLTVPLGIVGGVAAVMMVIGIFTLPTSDAHEAGPATPEPVVTYPDTAVVGYNDHRPGESGFDIQVQNRGEAVDKLEITAGPFDAWIIGYTWDSDAPIRKIGGGINSNFISVMIDELRPTHSLLIQVTTRWFQLPLTKLTAKSDITGEINKVYIDPPQEWLRREYPHMNPGQFEG